MQYVMHSTEKSATSKGKCTDDVCTPLEGALYAKSKNTNVLKAALQRCCIPNAFQLFKGSTGCHGLHRKMRYLQTKVSIIQAQFKLQ